MKSEAMEHYLVKVSRDDCVVHPKSDANIEVCIDEATWESNVSRLKAAVYENRIVGAFISRSGIHKVLHQSERLKQVILASALIIRLASILELFMDSGRHS